MLSREQSPSASTRTQVDDDQDVVPQGHHGEPDLEHQEAEESVPGRELDRQLSRVCCTDRVSLGDLVNDGADKSCGCSRRVVSTVSGG